MHITDIIIIIVQFIWGSCDFYIKKNMTANEEQADKKSYKVLYGITIISLIVGIAAGWLLKFYNIGGIYNDSIYFPIIGIIVILLGLFIRLSAIAKLKQYFTVNVTIREDHKLITDGLYKYIRHPAYAGGILSFIGCGICYGNIISLIIIALPYFILIIIRIKNEEAILTEKFGQDYINLQKKTKKLIPYIF
ncbi:MAG: isoprenylcysteine carboxylmethyltransferase family protein [Eubacteriaceae bacterium]|nr:isoprenylcysteine carboxylmethyltransferase family protein [Eubacteriaceae bacterium]